jgi:hypothetical protein
MAIIADIYKNTKEKIMSGTEFIASLPDAAGDQRNSMILNAANQGLLVVEWAPITSTVGEHTATFNVCKDAAFILQDDGSRFRVPACAKLEQQVADILQVSLLTSKIMDLRYDQADFKVNAAILPASPQMINTSASTTWNAKLEAKRNGNTGLFADTGKPFVLDNRIAVSMGAVLYGFFDTNAPYLSKMNQKLWQTLSDRHMATYSDYSSTMMFMQTSCTVDGQSMQVTDVMGDTELSSLLNYDGVLKYTRQPGV